MDFAFDYLKQELEQLNNELKETEKKIEVLENTLDFSSGVLDPRYKRLTDKYDNLNAHACSIRMKMVDYFASGNASTATSVASGSQAASAGAKRKSSDLSTNPANSLTDSSVVAKNLSINSTYEDPRSSNHMLVSSPDDKITAVIDRAPNNPVIRNTFASSIPMQVDYPTGSNQQDSTFPRPSAPQSSFPTALSSTTNNNFNSAWPSFDQTIFRNATPASQPTTVGASLFSNINKQPSSSLSPLNDKATGNLFSSSSSTGGNTLLGEKYSLDDINSAHSALSQVTQPLYTAPPRPSLELEASMLQTEEYVEMKKTVAKIMKMFHEKKLYFVALDGSPIYAQQYQAISLRVKAGERITDHIRGQMLSYVTGIDKKKQTISKTDLFLPDYHPLL